MAQNVTIAGASYSDVPSVTIPKSGGGSALFVDNEPIETEVGTQTSLISQIQNALASKAVPVNPERTIAIDSGGSNSLNYFTINSDTTRYYHSRTILTADVGDILHFVIGNNNSITIDGQTEELTGNAPYTYDYTVSGDTYINFDFDISCVCSNIEGLKLGYDSFSSPGTYSPSDGYAGFAWVTVEAPTGNIQLTQQTGTDVTGYETASVRSGSVTINTPTVDATGLVTATATVGTSGWVGSNPSSATLQLTKQAGKVVTPSTSQQTAVDAGKFTTGTVYVGAIPNQKSDSGNVTLNASTTSKSYAAGYYPNAHGAAVSVYEGW